MQAKPIHTVLVSTEIVGPYRNGGIGTFVTNFAWLLRNHGYEVSIVHVNRNIDKPREAWEYLYSTHDIRVLQVYHPGEPNIKQEQAQGKRGKRWFIEMTRRVADTIPQDADLVYFQELAGVGFTFHRRRHYQQHRDYPVTVTVTHGNRAWVREAQERYLTNLADLELDYIERYATALSDYVVAPSQYIMDWMLENGWRLPAPDYRRVLGLPFVMNQTQDIAPIVPHQSFKRIVFFGRLEVRKGFELLIDALVRLKHSDPQCIQNLQEIVFLGRNSQHRFSSEHEAQDYLRAHIKLPVQMITTLDTYQVNQYLIDHRADSLVVIPSLVDNFPNTVIEASLIPGLNLLLADTGGIPEIIGSEHHEQLFLPYVEPFADALAKWLRMGPQPAEKLAAPYDISRYNQGWLDFHREVCEVAGEARTRYQHYPKRLINLPEVDICIPFTDSGERLPHVLQGLEHQTAQNFSVTIVDDGTKLPESQGLFARMQEQYAGQGWQFIRNAGHKGLRETRNIAARLGKAKHIIFLELTTIPAPTMIEEFLSGIIRSDDDCLTCHSIAYTEETFPYNVQYKAGGSYGGIETLCKPQYFHIPVGNYHELALVFNVFGEGGCIIQREVFEAIGGFRTGQEHHRYIAGGYYELFCRLALAGYKLDVYPKVLFYRHITQEQSRPFQNKLPIQHLYRDRLREVGLEYLAPMIQSFGRNSKED